MIVITFGAPSVLPTASSVSATSYRATRPFDPNPLTISIDASGPPEVGQCRDRTPRPPTINLFYYKILHLLLRLRSSLIAVSPGPGMVRVRAVRADEFGHLRASAPHPPPARGFERWNGEGNRNGSANGGRPRPAHRRGRSCSTRGSVSVTRRLAGRGS